MRTLVFFSSLFCCLLSLDLFCGLLLSLSCLFIFSLWFCLVEKNCCGFLCFWLFVCVFCSSCVSVFARLHVYGLLQTNLKLCFVVAWFWWFDFPVVISSALFVYLFWVCFLTTTQKQITYGLSCVRALKATLGGLSRFVNIFPFFHL